jgi:hypothetical protein
MPKRRTIRDGDTVDSIAFDEGLFPETIWDHPANAELKRKSQDRTILKPGDVLTVPDKRVKEVPAASEQRHRYRRRGVPAVLWVRLLDWGEPRAGLPYTLDVEGKTVQGTTESDGSLRHWVPPNARQATLIIEGDESRPRREEYRLQIGHLTPASEQAGAIARLVNLHYLDEGKTRDEEAVKAAVRAFQEDYGLEATGRLDRATEEKLRGTHSC